MKFFTITSVAVASIVLGILTFTVATYNLLGQLTAETPADSGVYILPPTIDHVRKMAKFVSLQIHISEFVRDENSTWWSGHKAIWTVRGDALYIIDLDNATLEVLGSSQNGNRVRLTLPPPKVDWARVDHEKTELYELNENNASVLTIWGAPADLHELAMKDAQRAIFKSADQAEYREQAKEHAAMKLTSICKDLGSEAEIVWRESQ